MILVTKRNPDLGRARILSAPSVCESSQLDRHIWAKWVICQRWFLVPFLSDGSIPTNAKLHDEVWDSPEHCLTIEEFEIDQLQESLCANRCPFWVHLNVDWACGQLTTNPRASACIITRKRLGFSEQLR